MQSLLSSARYAPSRLAAIGAISGAGSALAASPAAASGGWEAPPLYAGGFNAAAFLKVNGVDLQGDNQQQGQEGSIECVYYQHSVRTAKEAGSGLATGKRQHNPVVIRKRIDQSTPLLYKALVQNQNVDGTFKFFRPNTDGNAENFYTVEIRSGRISEINEVSPDSAATNGDGNSGFLEEVAFVFSSIKWRFEQNGTEFQDSVNSKA